MHLVLMEKEGQGDTQDWELKRKRRLLRPRQAGILGRDETAGRRVERPLRLSLHFSFCQQGHFFLRGLYPAGFVGS